MCHPCENHRPNVINDNFNEIYLRILIVLHSRCFVPLRYLWQQCVMPFSTQFENTYNKRTVSSWFSQWLISLWAPSSIPIEICISFLFFVKGDYCQENSAYLTCENKSCAWGLQCHFLQKQNWYLMQEEASKRGPTREFVDKTKAWLMANLGCSYLTYKRTRGSL